ncbi:hypothetical protein Pmani_005712 [Petrolisthes manimaculis]|uniref:Uncharacterized protein n=1 Tax=Petrolisthes manimaculis TaxID=1843537 RepID=A0AAE1UH80_9EUCA|nr:hypothetical protein Pmani_005712 [Petrolisthes manimaculis]
MWLMMWQPLQVIVQRRLSLFVPVSARLGMSTLHQSSTTGGPNTIPGWARGGPPSPPVLTFSHACPGLLKGTRRNAAHYCYSKGVTQPALYISR